MKILEGNVSLVISKRLELELKKVIGNLNLQQPVQEVHIEKPPEPPIEKKVENFINGMMLLAAEYVTIKKDKVALNEIIKRIKV